MDNAVDPERSGEGHAHPPARRHTLDPVLIMLLAMLAAIAMTWIVPSGSFARSGKGDNAPVIAGTYAERAKPITWEALRPDHEAAPGLARPVSPLAVATAIPAGLSRSAGLIFMIMLLGGLFGVFRASGALDAGIERLIAISGGRVTVLVPVLMLAISAGSTFLGLISEYLLLIPVMVALARKLGRSPMFGFAVLTVAAKIGYLCSVTNPVALLIAQPIVGLPVFSGLGFRLGLWVLFLAIGIGWILVFDRREQAPEPVGGQRLAAAHIGALLVMAAVIALLVYGSLALDWDDAEFAALFVCAAIVMTPVARMPASAATAAFLTGMKSMVLAGLLVGMGRGVELILREGQILDTIINAVSHHVSGLPPVLVAPLLMLFEMGLTLLIPSTSAKAALSIPVLGPIAAHAGVSGQTTVLAFLLGNGLVNMVAPTSGMLLAYLAAAGIPYGQWLRWVLPLAGMLAVLSAGATMLAVMIGY